MSNHTIKAKNKLTSEIVEFTAMDYGYTYKYLQNIKPRVFLPDGTLEVPQYLSQQEFNDLFEVVEDTDTLKKEEVADKFLHLFNETDYFICPLNNEICQDKIADFITQEIAKAKEEIVDIIEKQPVWFGFDGKMDETFNAGAHHFQQELLKKLNNK